MISIEDKINNYSVLERFIGLQQENLEPKLGVYEGNRLVIVAHTRTSFCAKIYQLFLNIIYNPILSICGKLSFNERRISDLRNDVEVFTSGFRDKQCALEELTTKIEAYERRVADAQREIESSRRELLEKAPELQKVRAAEGRIDDLTLQIWTLERKIEELSTVEKQYAPAEQKIKGLRETISQLESQISALRINAEQLSYKQRCESLQSEVDRLRYASNPRAGFCMRCHLPYYD